MPEPCWDVVDNDRLDPRLLEETSALIQSWFPDARGTVVSAADLRWKLGPSNPAGPGFMTNATVDGRVIGSITCTRKRWVLDGEVLPVAEIGDSFTDPAFLKAGAAREPWPDASDPERQAYLSRSVFGRVVTATLQRADAAGVRLVFGVANETAARAYLRHLEFRTWDGHELVTYARPGPALLAARARIPRPLASVALRAHAALPRRARVEVVPLDGDLGVVDEIWERVRPRTRLSPLRDATWLRWRFLERPGRTYRLHVVHRGGVELGWFVTYRTADEVLVADWCFGAPHAPLGAMLGWAAREATADTARCALWSQEPWPTASRLGALAFATHRPGLIVRCDPALVAGADSASMTIAASDNV